MHSLSYSSASIQQRRCCWLLCRSTIRQPLRPFLSSFLFSSVIDQKYNRNLSKNNNRSIRTALASFSPIPQLAYPPISSSTPPGRIDHIVLDHSTMPSVLLPCAILFMLSKARLTLNFPWKQQKVHPSITPTHRLPHHP